MRDFFKKNAINHRSKPKINRGIVSAKLLLLFGGILLVSGVVAYHTNRLPFLNKKKILLTKPTKQLGAVITPITANVCAGSGTTNLGDIVITEAMAGDFKEGKGTLVLGFTSTNFLLDDVTLPSVTITTSASSDAPTISNRRFINNRFSFDFDFTETSTSEINTITIGGLKVEATELAEASTTLKVAGDVDHIEVLDITTPLGTINRVNPSDAGEISGFNVIFDGQTVMFETPMIGGASGYEWVLTGSGATALTPSGSSDQRMISYTVAHTGAGKLEANLKVRVVAGSCKGKYSAIHPITIYNPSNLPAGAPKVNLNIPHVTVCQGTGAQTIVLNDIVVTERNVDDFNLSNNSIDDGGSAITQKAIGVIFKNPGDSDFAFDFTQTAPIVEIMNGASLVSSTDGSANGMSINPRFNSDGGSGIVNNLANDKPQFAFSFGMSTFDVAIKEKVTIRNLEVDIKDLANVSSAELWARANAAPFGLDFGTVLANIKVEALPDNPGAFTGANAMVLGEVQTFTVPTINHATTYEWTVPAGFVEQGTIVTQTPTITLTANSVVTNAMLTVRGVNNNVGTGCLGNTASHTVNINKPVVATKPSKGICVGSEADLDDIVVTESAIGGMVSFTGEKTIALQLPGGRGFEFVTTTLPTITVNGDLNITARRFPTGDRFEFDFELPAPRTAIENVAIANLRVKVSDASVGTAEVQISGDGVNQLRGIFQDEGIATVTASPIPLIPTKGTIPTQLCRNTTTTTLSVNLVTDMTYNWELPDGVTISSSSVSNSNSINVDVASGATLAEGTIRVRAVSATGCIGPWLEQKVEVTDIPVAANDIASTDSQPLENRTIVLSVDPIAQADEYVWVMDNQLIPQGVTASAITEGDGSGGTINRTQVITTSNRLIVKTGFVTATTNAIVKVKGRSLCGDGNVSNNKTITVRDTDGLSINDARVDGLCVGGDYHLIPDIVLSENNMNDFGTGTKPGSDVTGTLVLKLDKGGFELNETPPSVYFDDPSTPFTTTVSGDKQSISIDYVFTPDSYDATNEMIISGLRVRAVAANNDNNVTILTPLSGAGKLFRVYPNVTLATIQRLDVPATPVFETSSNRLCVNANATFAVEPVTGVSTYEWEFPSGITEGSGGASPHTTSAPTINLSVEATAVAGEVRVRGISNDGCKGDWQNIIVEIRKAPVAPTIIEGPGTLFEGESTTYEVPFVDGADKYIWTLPTGLSSTDGNVGTDANTRITDVNRIQVTAATTVPVTNPVSLNVKGLSDDCGEGPGIDKVIQISPSGVNVTQATLNNVCIGRGTSVVPDITLEEVFKNDFSGSGVIKILPNNTSFTLVQGANTSVEVSGVNNIGVFNINVQTEDVSGTSRKVLNINYNFNNDSENRVNRLVIKNLGVQASDNTNTSAKLQIINDPSGQLKNLTQGTDLATVNSVPSPTISDENRNTFQAALTQCAGTTFDLSVTGMNNATSYQWVLPNGIEPDGGGTITSQTARLVVLEAAESGSAEIRVRGIGGEGCKGAWLSKNIIIKAKPNVSAGIFGDMSICQGKSATYFIVPPPGGADQYEWTLPDGLTTTDTDDNGDPAVFATNVNKITVKAGAPPLAGNVVILRGRGISTGCVGAPQADFVEYSITINPVPDVVIQQELGFGPELLNDGESFSSSADPIPLIGSPAGGVFSGPGIGAGDKFHPNIAGEGSDPKKITYTYTTDEGCVKTKEINLFVREATRTGLKRDYCKGDSEDAFGLDKIVSSNAGRMTYIHKLIAAPGLSGGVVTDGATQTQGELDPEPMGDPDCSYAGIETAIGSVVNTNYRYSFDPSAVTGTSVEIKAIMVELNTSGCLRVYIETLDNITINNLPTPDIKNTTDAIVCKDQIVTYEIQDADLSSTYTWNLPGGGGSFVDGKQEGSSVQIKWETPSATKYKVSVTESNRNTCRQTDEIDVTVKPLPTPHIMSGNGTFEACERTKVTYTAAQDATGTEFPAGYTFEWSINKGDGSITNIMAKSIEVNWETKDGSLELKVTAPAAEGGCLKSLVQNITINSVLKPALGGKVTGKNKEVVCANADEVYNLSSTSNLAGITWNVKGGTITNAGASTTGDVSSITNIAEISIRWDDTPEASITINEVQGDCEGTTTVGISVIQVAKPGFDLAETYCNNVDDDITLVPFIGPDKKSLAGAGGSGKFLEEVAKDIDGKPIYAAFAATFKASSLTLGNHTIVYEYTAPSGCIKLSDPQSFEIIAPPVVNLSVTGFADDIKPSFCFLNNEQVTLVPTLGEAPDITSPGANDGFFIIKRGDVEVLTLDRGVNTFRTGLLTEGGDYSIIYKYTKGCATDSKSKTIEIVKTIDLGIKTKNADGTTAELSEYCVREETAIFLVPTRGSGATLVEDLNPSLVDGERYFEIRRVNGNKSINKNFVKLTDNDGNLTNIFNPSNPIPLTNPEMETHVAPGSLTADWNRNAGTYEIKYTFTDTKGAACESFTKDIFVVVKPLPDLTFFDLEKTYCDDITNVSLTALNSGKIEPAAQFKYRRVFANGSKSDEQVISGGVLNPHELGTGQYEIFVRHTEDGCENRSDRVQTIDVLPVPKDVKIKVTKDYNKNVMNFSATDINSTVEWKWNWKIEDETSSKQTATRFFSKSLPGVVNYQLEVKTKEQGCVTTIDKRFRVELDFSGQCAGATTHFTSTLSLGDDTGNYEWDFGDKSAKSLEPNPKHIYRSPGTYWVTLTITTDDGIATYSLRRRIDIFPLVIVNQQQFYTEGFEGGTSGWISHGVVDVDRILVDSTSWTLKQPDGFLIRSKTGNAWVTDNRDNPNRTTTNANYNSNEQSYVESPCFDIGDLSKPMISFRYWSNTDEGADGVVLLYTIDDGKTWERLGKQDFGIDWYDTKFILGAPGALSNVLNNQDDQGWSGTNGEWRFARFSLTEVLVKMNDPKFTGKDKVVRFRMSFGSNGDNPFDSDFDGFAFDNVVIGNRNRIVLLEYFINEGIANAEAVDLTTKNFPQTGNQDEVISIHHHTDFPGIDALNQQNEKDPSARSFYHGIREVPRVVVDGYFNDVLMGQWTQDYFADRTLITSPFNINIGQPSVSGTTFKVSASVTAVQNFDRPVVMHVVLIDSVVNVNGKTFYNVVRKMLPDAAGTYKKTGWALGDNETLDFNWDIGGLDPKTLQVVVFVEDYETKEVHQAARSSVRRNRTEEGQSEHQVTSVTKDLQSSGGKLFPNPALKTIQVQLDANRKLSAGATWEIISIKGASVKKGIWKLGKQSMSVDVSELADGFYIFLITDQSKKLQLRFEKQ